jgi:predicted nuclease of restriction endonuclease-like (RecB) superfamily
MTMSENWSVRVLQDRISNLRFERTAIAKQGEEVIKADILSMRNEGEMSPEMFLRDPYFLDFLDLPNNYSEKDIESAILVELEKFILEFGKDFAFLGRQKRITVDDVDYYIDLLFFHRKLKRLVVIELKLDKFKPEHKGQVELYLRWLKKYEMNEGEEDPIAIILVAEKSDETVKLLELGASGMHVAEYLTELPPRDVLENQLRLSIKRAKIAIGAKGKAG